MTNEEYNSEAHAKALGWYFVESENVWKHPAFPLAKVSRAKYAVEDHSGWVKHYGLKRQG